MTTDRSHKIATVYNRIPVVKDALVVMGPRHATEFDVLENVFEIFAGFHVLEFDLDPVRTALTHAVGEQRSIFGKRSAGKGYLSTNWIDKP